jgi:TRAP-type C4-dicarboxylate transport system permease small subunit
MIFTDNLNVRRAGSLRPALITLEGVNRHLEHGLERLLQVLLFAFVGLIAYQILSRNLPALPVIYWSEELARFSFQWSIAFGTALGVLHADHFVLHAFKPGRRADRACRLIAELAMLALALYLMIYGYEFADSGWHRKSTAARLPMFWMYITFTTCGSIMLLFSLQRLLGLWLYGFAYLERLGDTSALNPDGASDFDNKNHNDARRDNLQEPTS